MYISDQVKFNTAIQLVYSLDLPYIKTRLPHLKSTSYCTIVENYLDSVGKLDLEAEDLKDKLAALIKIKHIIRRKLDENFFGFYAA